MGIVEISFALIALSTLVVTSLASVAGFLASRTDTLAAHSRALDAAHDSRLAAPILPMLGALSLPAEALGRLMLGAGALALTHGASERKRSIRAHRIGYRARSLHCLAPAWLGDGQDIEHAEIGDREARIGEKAVMLYPAFRKAATLGKRRESLRLAA